MSQPSITSFFVSKKRAAPDDGFSWKKKNGLEPKSKYPKVLCNDKFSSPSKTNEQPNKSLQTLPPTFNKITDLHISKDARKAVAKLTFDNFPSSKNDSASQGTSSTGEKIPSHSESKKPDEDSGIDIPVTSINICKEPGRNSNQQPEADKVTRKDLNLCDIKKKLSNSKKLAALKASAAKFSNDYQKLKQLDGKKMLKEFKTIQVEVPTSPSKKIKNEIPVTPKKVVEVQPLLMSPRKVVVSPVKSPSKVPAYIRHASLVTKSTSLPLPRHYKLLAELFRALETVSSIRFNRNEKNTFSKLKPSIQEMLKKNFTTNHLSQIKFLVSDFYKFELEKAKPFGGQREVFDLLITPSLPSDVKTMNTNIILERERLFYGKLLQHVKDYHKKFLESLDSPIHVSDDKLVRWHPEFELEKVPEIECADLPEIPNVEKFSTAEDVLSKARDLFNCNTKMGRALEKLAEMKSRGMTVKEKALLGLDKDGFDNSVQTSNAPTTSTVTLLNPALRNLPTALLEKIKAKQAAKALEAMTRTSEDDKKYLLYSRLPDLARTLRNIFVTERKNVLALNVVLSKLDSSFKARVSANDLHNDIKTLAEIVPGWIKLLEIRNTLYVRLDKAAILEEIKAKLESIADKYKP